MAVPEAEVAAGLDRRAGLRRGEEQRALRRAARGERGRRRRGRWCRARAARGCRRRTVSMRATHLGEQARPAHADQQHVVDPSAETLANVPEPVEPGHHVGHPSSHPSRSVISVGSSRQSVWSRAQIRATASRSVSSARAASIASLSDPRRSGVSSRITRPLLPAMWRTCAHYVDAPMSSPTPARRPCALFPSILPPPIRRRPRRSGRSGRQGAAGGTVGVARAVRAGPAGHHRRGHASDLLARLWHRHRRGGRAAGG